MGAGAGLFVKNAALDENLLTAYQNGAVTLYYDNAAKLATTSSGIDVTGTVTSDGLTVDGTATISSASGDTLTLKKATGAAFVFNNTTATTAAITGINGADGMDFRVGSAQTFAARIDASGKFGIGTGSPGVLLDVSGATPTIRAVGTSASNPSLTLSSAGITAWSQTVSGSDSSLSFNKDGSEKMRIDSSGNLLVGNTDSTPYDRTSGNAIALGDGLISSAQEGGNAAIFNRMTSDGSIVQFRKDGTTVGSIQSRAGLVTTLILDPRASGAGITGGGVFIYPTDNTGGLVDNSISLGNGTYRFKDLYLSGSTIVSSRHLTAQGTVTTGYQFIGDGDSGMFQQASNQLQFSTANAERMRITSGGGVIVGGSATSGTFSVYGSGGGGIELAFNTTASNATIQSYSSSPLLINPLGNNVGIGVSGTPSYQLEVGSAVKFDGQIRASTGSAALPAYTFHADNTLGMFRNPNVLGFAVAGTERMRIDSSGRLLVGTTSANGTVTIGGTQIPNQPALYIKAYPTNHPTSYIYRDNTDAQYCLKLRHDGPVSGSGLGYMAVFTDRNDTTVGSITVSGSTTAYNTSSDARLKEVTGSARGLEVINALNPVSYNWKKSGQADEGLLAQEVLEIVPNAVSGSEEEYYQMDYSKLVTHLVAGMKEQQVLIEQLQAEVALLKGE